MRPNKVKQDNYKIILCDYCKEYNHGEKAVYELNGVYACGNHVEELKQDYIKYKEAAVNDYWRW